MLLDGFGLEVDVSVLDDHVECDVQAARPLPDPFDLLGDKTLEAFIGQVVCRLTKRLSCRDEFTIEPVCGVVLLQVFLHVHDPSGIVKLAVRVLKNYEKHA